jgi:hypothetical protein
MTTQLKEHTEVLEARIQCLIDKLLAHYAKQYGDGGIAFDVVKGVKYYKLIQRDVKRSTLNGNTGASVHAFIDRQSGSVYKPASWKAPAKIVRYNLMDEVSYADCLLRADWAGGYLYIR